MKSIAVFCGSSPGSNEKVVATAKETGMLLAKKGIRLVYGGASIGLMGTVADACLSHGGEVIGVIPDFLRSKEIAHKGLTELILTKSMHERKQKMFELSEGFIALPGGYGTMDEVFEMLTWAQLGIHNFPIGFLNAESYYDPLLAMVGNMANFALLKEDNRRMILHSGNIADLLEQMEKYQPLKKQASGWFK